MRIATSRAGFILNVHSKLNRVTTMPDRRSSDCAKFKDIFDKSKSVVVLTGAGISAESGVPTFRGPGGFWRKYRSTDLATPQAFNKDPSLVWQFYEYRRQLVATKSPNRAHQTLAELEKKFAATDRKLSVITQNVDSLHQLAGSKNVIELHGTLYKTRCTKCQNVTENRTIPIVPALENIIEDEPYRKIEGNDLPRCTNTDCNGLVRPHIVWFNESLEDKVMEDAHALTDTCDLLLVIGTSSVVYPAAMFAPMVASRGVVIGEFNLESTLPNQVGSYFFAGPCGQTLPKTLLGADGS